MDRITGLEPELSKARPSGPSRSEAELILYDIIGDPGAWLRESEGDCWDCRFCDSGFWNRPMNVVHVDDCPIVRAHRLLGIAC
jgi:hypothetical protein